MHLLTIGDPESYAFRVTLGRLSRRGKFHAWQPCAFFIWKGKARL